MSDQFEKQFEVLRATYDGRILVVVHQLVRSLTSEVLSDSQVGHRFAFTNGQISSMEFEPEPHPTLHPGPHRRRPRHPGRLPVPRIRQGAQAARRWVREAR